MALTNAQRQKQYRDRLKARGLSTVTLTAQPDLHGPLRALAAKLRDGGQPFPLPVTPGEAVVLLQVLRSIRDA